MPLIGPWVHGYSLRTIQLQVARSLHQIGVVAPTGIAQQGYLIDIHAQLAVLRIHSVYIVGVVGVGWWYGFILGGCLVRSILRTHLKQKKTTD